MKIILNPKDKTVILTDDKNNLVDNFVVGLKNQHTLFIKVKDEETINSYKILYKVVYDNGNTTFVYDYEYRGVGMRIVEETSISLLPDDQIEQYFFIPNDFLKDYRYWEEGRRWR